MHRLCGWALVAMMLYSLQAAAVEKCRQVPEDSGERLRAYSEKNGNTPLVFSVAAVGNNNFMLDENYIPESPQELASVIMASPKFADAKEVLLVWPYSTLPGTFAPALAGIVHKRVIGFSGPLWWYPDGSAVSTHAGKDALALPQAGNVAECLTSEGRYYSTQAACGSVVKSHKAGDAVFGNVVLELSCAEITALTVQAQKDNAEANLRFYLYDEFVTREEDKAIAYLSKAASLGNATANYIVAQSLRGSATPSGRKMYLQTLRRAAEGGLEKAKAELSSQPQ